MLNFLRLCYIFTSFCALFTSLCTALAMVVVMFLAFCSACFTNGCASFRQFRNKWRIARNRVFQIRTDVRAFTVQTDAFSHHFDIVFFQARVKAMVASFRAVVQDFDQFCMLFMSHSDNLQFRFYCCLFQISLSAKI